ncbi:barstar family protein [Bacillus sp. RG28]|uniref:Barstar family protein n=1 Tax=Gottfriedia endophytica TaxID=2820819 RepID=A0A940NGZ9_9BACI|nr:barstar family protein [Gottfriedia endophytica]MBP0723837.1 barstar family protein [Gottfriedia endophytica]
MLLPKPPLRRNVHYDAFNDSLWGGLSEISSEKVALIWTDFNKLLDEGFNDFLQISECIYKIAEDLTHTEYGIDHEVKFKVFLLGEGKNFPTI